MSPNSKALSALYYFERQNKNNKVPMAKVINPGIISTNILKRVLISEHNITEVETKNYKLDKQNDILALIN